MWLLGRLGTRLGVAWLGKLLLGRLWLGSLLGLLLGLLRLRARLVIALLLGLLGCLWLGSLLGLLLGLLRLWRLWAALRLALPGAVLRTWSGSRLLSGRGLLPTLRGSLRRLLASLRLPGTLAVLGSRSGSRLGGRGLLTALRRCLLTPLRLLARARIGGIRGRIGLTALLLARA